ncbi:MAG: hypothetical protein ABEJ22_02660 [Haloferacaceae archaeon]
MSGETLQTTFEFTLPQGYVDDEGTRHREGTMRLASAADELKPLTDPRVQSNESYFTVILLSRVVTEIGSVTEVTPGVVENLFVADLSYLQDLYGRVNDRGANVVDATCPDCGTSFRVSADGGPSRDREASAGGSSGNGD